MTTFTTATKRGAVALLLGLTLAAATAGAATITIVNNNAAGIGFNDPTPRAPVGGNYGTTLGQQRLIVFQGAATEWGKILTSPVQILVRAQFANQTCTATSATLGSAGAVTAHANFAGAPLPNYWYGQALANSRAGVDLSPTQPDINATFNMAIDAGCFGPGQVWYYGFDGLEGPNIELLPVVLHEIGHGLGFQTFTSTSSGAQLGPPANPAMPTIYDRFLHDNTSGLNWDGMTNAQRQASAINTDNLVWSGATVTAAAANYLANRPRMLVLQPAGIAGSYDAGGAGFGAALTLAGHTNNVELGNDGAGVNVNDGCEALAANVNGKIALLDRGNCTFVIKAQNAQAAGATGLLIANNVGGPLAPGGVDPTITIPVIGITQANGTMLKTELAVPNKVQVTIGLHPTLKAGADNAGFVQLYTPNPLQSGSSVSHFNVTVSPNALMEPAINADLHNAVDMTWSLFQDIGWAPDVTPTLLATFSAEGRTTGIMIRWQFQDLTDVGSITLERAIAEDGPWAAIQTELSSEGQVTTAFDNTAEFGKTYFYRLSVMNRRGGTEYYGLVSAKREAMDGHVALSAPAPNPASVGAAFTVRITRPEYVRLGVVDAAGRKIRTLQEGMMSPGEHPLSWNLRSDSGSSVGSGLYFVTVTTSEGTKSQRVAVIN